MRVLLITSSARGHALGEALARSRSAPDIVNICTSRNPGLRRLCSEQYVGDIMNFEFVLDIAQKGKYDFAVIGPDDPIGAGLADILEDIGIPCIAPRRALARLESSKGFTRNLMQKYGIDASPKFQVFTSGATQKEIERYMIDDLQSSFVVKYDALKGGKGVKVSGEHLAGVSEGVSYALECIAECGTAVVEEKLVGVEFSLLSFVSRTQLIDMPAVQDHKRAFEGDAGPNTGGMGTFTDSNHSLPFLERSDLEQASAINRSIAEAVMKECGHPYRGILYGGFMAVKDGIRVIEYNARFGDPEALNLLSLLESDFVDLCLSMIEGSLTPSLAQFARKASVCTYIVPRSYPDAKNERGQPVSFPDIPSSTARIYYGDIAEADNNDLLLGGSRTAGIVGIADTIDEAQRTVCSLCEQVKGPVRFRADIGTDQLIRQRIDFMHSLRA